MQVFASSKQSKLPIPVLGNYRVQEQAPQSAWLQAP